VTAVVVALIAALGSALTAWIAHRSKGAAESASSSGASVLAAVHRIEGKVDALQHDLRDVMDWRAVHEADHAPPPLVVAPRSVRRARG
jgi:hypothetical protein